MSALPQHLDIHLIRILYLLLVEKNVSRVALKLNQPQPSISASLRKLRELTGDPLLVRGARGMVPTQHGESLLKPAKRILDEAESLFVKKTPFVPQEEARTFNIAAPDYLDSQFLPNVVAMLRRGSPKSRVVIHSIGPGGRGEASAWASVEARDTGKGPSGVAIHSPRVIRASRRAGSNAAAERSGTGKAGGGQGAVATAVAATDVVTGP